MSAEVHFETHCLPLNVVVKLSFPGLILNYWPFHRGPGIGFSCLNGCEYVSFPHLSPLRTLEQLKCAFLKNIPLLQTPFLVQIRLVYKMNSSSDCTKFILDSSVSFIWTEDGKRLRVNYFKNNYRVLALQAFLSH